MPQPSVDLFANGCNHQQKESGEGGEVGLVCDCGHAIGYV